MRYIPWFTLVLAVILAAMPEGQKTIGSAIHNGEQLAQSMNRIVLMIVAATLAGAALVEIAVRFWIGRRKGRKLINGGA